MSDNGTKERLLDAAEKLFAEHGFASTSLRAITSEAEANLAAVNYYFGSKELLLRAAFNRLAGPVNDERLALLDQIEARHAPRPAPVDDIVDAFFRPALQSTATLGKRVEITRKFLGRVVSDPSMEVRSLLTNEFREVTSRFSRALERALPHLDREQVALRFQLMIGVLVRVQTEESLTPGRGRKRPSQEDILRTTLDFVRGGLREPPSIRSEQSQRDHSWPKPAPPWP